MIFIVLPAYNEAEALPPMIRRIKEISDRFYSSTISIIVVDDGSSDDTGLIAQKPYGIAVQLVTHLRNRGLSEAIKTGLTWAVEHSSDEDLIVTMDADNTHPVGLIPRMAMLIDEGNDIVVASRYQRGARVIGVPTSRQLFSTGASLLFRLVYPITGVKDYTCGFRAYRRTILAKGMEHWGENFISEKGFSCMVDILIKLHQINAIITEAPMVLRYDLKPGKSKMNVRKTIVETVGLLARRRIGRL
jgi:dolichol-phosphate mannosyltransferase